MKNEIESLIIDNNIRLKPSYSNPEKPTEWELNRCRIDANFFVESILDHLINNLSGPKITEKYLTKTRNIQNKSNENYKVSNSMDFAAIKNWFKIKKVSKENHQKLLTYQLEDIEEVIVEYIDKVLKQNLYLENEKIMQEWKIFYSSKSIYKLKNIEIKIQEYMQEKSNKLKLLTNKDLYENTKDFSAKNTYDINIDPDNKEKEQIGEAGEKLVNDHLIEKYGIENVTWSSRKNKYANHDFEVKLKNNEIKYIEVKSTSKPEMRRFFISRNEYNFYQQNKKNYDLYFVSNIIYWTTNNKEYQPTLIIKNSPSIKIDLNKSGYQNDEILITPNNFIASW